MSDIHAAARNGDLAALQSAIGAGQSLDARDNLRRTPLMLAAWAGQVKIISISAECWLAAMFLLCLPVQLDALKLLLANGADHKGAAADDMNALHFAAQKGHTEAARHVINAGALPLLPCALLPLEHALLAHKWQCR